MLLTRLKNSNLLLYTGLLMLVAGLPVSLFLTSLSQFFLAGSLFLEGNLRKKLQRFINNRAAVFLVTIWLIHLVGLLWTSDLAEGIKDLRIKLPLLILPLVMASGQPLSQQQFRRVLQLFAFSVFCGSMVSMAVLAGWTHHRVLDIRDVFIFHISHIRFALFVCIAIFSLAWMYFSSEAEAGWKNKTLHILLIIWLLVFLFIIESVTGLVVLSCSIFVLLIYYFSAIAKGSFRYLWLALILLVPLISIAKIYSWVNEHHKVKPYKIQTTDLTLSGRPYYFEPDVHEFENGYPVWVYICEEELRMTWNMRSSFTYDSTDLKGQPLKSTLIRFLSSKGLRKDSVAVANLEESEVQAIEQGVANVLYQDKSSLKSRVLQIAWEIDQYNKGKNPSGHSVTQRLEFWKAAIGIIKSHPLTGVGTGDLKIAYRDEYERMNSQLEAPFRLKAHNQYLSFAVAFGVPLAILIIILFFYPLKRVVSSRNFLFAAYIIIAALSMLTEDTMETQSGATFIALFYCLFLFSQPLTKDTEII